jgi:hypothetical protein
MCGICEEEGLDAEGLEPSIASESSDEEEEASTAPSSISDPEPRTNLGDIFADIQRPTSIAAIAPRVLLPNPGLIIRDHGLVRRPVSSSDVRAIAAKPPPTTSGNHYDPVGNKMLPRSWELRPDQFKPNIPERLLAISKLVQQSVRENSGISATTDNKHQGRQPAVEALTEGARQSDCNYD